MKDFANRGRRRGSRRADAESDASDFFFGSSDDDAKGRRRRSHKTAQLCRQVFRAVSLALSECTDDLLRDLIVHDVRPAPDASRMLVYVEFSVAAAQAGAHVADAMERLASANGFLRREVAAAITRKRAPELMFIVVAGGNRKEVTP